MKKHFTTILFILILAAGLSLLLYPTVADYWNSFHQSRAIATYAEQVGELDTAEQDRMLAQAQAYNAGLWEKPDRYRMTDAELAEYGSLLDVSGTGMMGYVEVPAINCRLPIYHGNSKEVLQIAVGHLEGSSLPVGGAGTHCVLTAHRGLPSAKLFTDIDQLTEGDVFLLRVLGETLTYQVDQIRIVLPSETQDLSLVEGEDYCTLVTCTPYGVNSHRLLVRGRRAANAIDWDIGRDAVRVGSGRVALVLGAALFLAMTLAGALRRKG